MLEKNLYKLQMENGFRPLPVRNISTITCQMLTALDKLSIIHAVFKLENIMIVNQQRFLFRVKLIDLGSSSIFSDVCFVKEPYIQFRFGKNWAKYLSDWLTFPVQISSVRKPKMCVLLLSIFFFFWNYSLVSALCKSKWCKSNCRVHTICASCYYRNQ